MYTVEIVEKSMSIRETPTNVVLTNGNIVSNVDIKYDVQVTVGDTKVVVNIESSLPTLVSRDYIDYPENHPMVYTCEGDSVTLGWRKIHLLDQALYTKLYSKELHGTSYFITGACISDDLENYVIGSQVDTDYEPLQMLLKEYLTEIESFQEFSDYVEYLGGIDALFDGEQWLSIMNRFSKLKEIQLLIKENK